ncbi:hypothetical protein [Streptomyces sp. Ru71]|uniref:hypothetical protein n=1 Tax=Streptomyces sp. Ru71 TaxID=2080746 RepID=UPI0015E2FF51|nr:hypothetical protein [Streptomyces sp. Ru71]
MTTAALTVVALAALAACSGNGSDASGGSDGSGKSSGSAAPTRQAGPAERLAQLMVTPAQVGGRSVEKPGEDYAFAASPSEVRLDKAVCAPLAYAMNQLPLGEPQADLTRVVKTDSMSDAPTYVTLTAYAPGGARSALSGLEKAVGACGAGFTATSKNAGTTYASVAAEQPTAPAGDERTAFKATLTVNGVTHALHTEAVRAGDVVAVYFSVNGMAIAQNRPSDAKPMPAVVNAQNARLR